MAIRYQEHKDEKNRRCSYYLNPTLVEKIRTVASKSTAKYPDGRSDSLLVFQILTGKEKPIKL